MGIELLRNRLVETGGVRPRVAALVEAGMDLSRIAVEAGVRRHELQTWFETKTPCEKVEQRLAAWLDDDAEDQGDPGAVEMETRAQISQALEFARSTPTISLVYGEAGLGKTWSALHYRDKHNRTAGADGSVYYAAASRWVRSPSAILEKIAHAMQSYGRAYRTDSLADAILSRFRRGDLLIIDEAQHLVPDSLDGIRHFHDEGGIGIAYLGNTEVFARITGKGRRAAFAQLSSRIGKRLHLTAPKPGDVDAILEAWSISGRPEREYGQQIAAGPGGLRQLMQVLRQARILARGMKQPVNQRIMRAAAGALGLND